MSDLKLRKGLFNQSSRKTMQIKEILIIKELIMSSSPVADIIKYLDEYTFKNDKSLNSMVSEALKSKRKIDEKIRILYCLFSMGLEKRTGLENSNKMTDNLLKIISFGDNDLIKLIISLSFNLKVKDEINKNALYHFIDSNNDNDEIVEMLVKQGISLEDKDLFEGHTPLTLSAKKMMIKTLKALIQLGANVNHKVENNGFTSLHYALCHKREDMVQSLISRSDLDLTIKNNEGFNPIELSAKENLWKIYEMLVIDFKKKQEKELLEKNQKKAEDSNEAKNINNNMNNGDVNISINNNSANNFNNINNSFQGNNNQNNINININNNSFSPIRRNKINNQKYVLSYSNKINLYSSDTILSIPLPLHQSPQARNNNYVSRPVLHIDISEEIRENNSNNNNERDSKKEDLFYENKVLNEEISRLKMELKLKDQAYKRIEDELNTKLSETKKQLEEKTETIMSLKAKNEDIMKEINELVKIYLIKKSNKKEEISKINIDMSTNKIDFLQRKFCQNKYDDFYVCKNLHKDLIDYQEFNKEQIKRLKATQEELLELVQEAVDESIPEFELKIYGSHATNLCLPWSDLDLVLIPRNNYSMISNNNNNLQLLYYCLLEKDWKRSVKLIDSAIIPIIKLTSNEAYNKIQIDLSIQDSKHYGIKCVELVKSFLKEYEVLEPLVFALKNILKNASLNDPYTGGLSSYGLILLIVSFLQREIEYNYPNKINDLGVLFLKFLFYYGCDFDQTNTVVYAYIPGEQGPIDREAINNYFNNLQSCHDLIIVDPLNKTNNVAKSTFQFGKIKMAFMIAYIVSHEECECSCHYNKTFDNGIITNIDHCMLKRVFTSIKRFNS